jgi:LPS-assembly protein
MPLRLRYIAAALSLAVPLTAWAGDLGWKTDKELATYEGDNVPEPPAWCGGAYFNPSLASVPETSDTVVTADESRLVPDGPAELSGDVRIEQPGRLLSADAALFNQASGDFELRGNIHVETPTAVFNANGMRGNSKHRQAVLEDVEYAIFPIHARGSAEKIDQDQSVIRIERGAYTTCPPTSDGWLLHARDIQLNRDQGWGEARNVWLTVEKVPVIWVPWITFPIDDRRKSGLLFPSIASADEGGMDITQPLYLNLHPQVDATLAPRHIHGRGNGLETEFRYLTPLGEGTISHAWLAKDRLFDDEERELARWYHQGRINNWALSADVNRVSDDFYFKDLDTGLEVSAQTHLPRAGSARYQGRTWRGLIRVQSWQTIDPTLAESNYPYRRMPQLQLGGDPTLFGPLKLLWLSDFTRFDRDIDDTLTNITGERSHIEPALTLPLRNSWGYLEPRARLYHTRYSLEQAETLPDDKPERTLGGASLDSGLFLERSFADNHWLQTLEPRLFFNYVDYEPQTDLPDFDAGELTFSWQTLFRENRFSGFDRIGDEKKMAVGLTSRFIRQASGHEVVRLRAGQGFYEEDRQVTLDGNPATREETPLVADARWRLDERWYADAEVLWDSDENRRQRHGVSLGYAGNDRHMLHAGYQYRAPWASDTGLVRQAELGGIWAVHDNWSLLGRWLYDVDNERSLETLAGLEYRDCCWNIRLVNHYELSDENGDRLLEPDRTILLQIQMIGLGGFGGRVDGLLERSLPRYDAR